LELTNRIRSVRLILATALPGLSAAELDTHARELVERFGTAALSLCEQHARAGVSALTTPSGAASPLLHPLTPQTMPRVSSLSLQASPVPFSWGASPASSPRAFVAKNSIASSTSSSLPLPGSVSSVGLSSISTGNSPGSSTLLTWAVYLSQLEDLRAAQVVQQSAVRQLLETAVEAKQLDPSSVSGADTSINRVAQLTTKLGSRALNVVKGVLARRLSGGSYAGDLSFATLLAETEQDSRDNFFNTANCRDICRQWLQLRGVEPGEALETATADLTHAVSLKATTLVHGILQALLAADTAELSATPVSSTTLGSGSSGPSSGPTTPTSHPAVFPRRPGRSSIDIDPRVLALWALFVARRNVVFAERKATRETRNLSLRD